MVAVKESSDEVIADSAVAQPGKARPFKDYFALTIATCGVGYLPLAPGTWGSLVAVGLYVYSQAVLLGGHIDTPGVMGPTAFVVGLLVVIVIITVLGIWAASRTERLSQTKDPGKVVIDEVAGQLIALWPLPLLDAAGWPLMIVLAFLLFRFFDIVKPYPARRFELLKTGLGIMADDLVAGVYAAVVVTLAVVVFQNLRGG